ncbi:MAG: hypothetical protein KDD55_04785, partial [Bdellovibrionales bacterium]|nr:hypothetical protein [Bdellovibrionales bacterium]
SRGTFSLDHILRCGRNGIRRSTTCTPSSSHSSRRLVYGHCSTPETQGPDNHENGNGKRG